MRTPNIIVRINSQEDFNCSAEIGTNVTDSPFTMTFCSQFWLMQYLIEFIIQIHYSYLTNQNKIHCFARDASRGKSPVLSLIRRPCDQRECIHTADNNVFLHLYLVEIMEGHCTRDDTIISKVYPLLESSDSLTHLQLPITATFRR